MASAGEFPELAWTREQLLDLADRLDAPTGRALAATDLQQDLRSAATALRFIAALAVQDECRQEAPFKPLYRIRKSDGVLVWTCGHKPPHESPA